MLLKLNKIRDSFKERYENDSSLGKDYVSINPNNPKVDDIWTLLKEPFFKYSINELSILKALKILDCNLSKLNKEDNLYVISDLLRYKLTDPNVVFEDYLKKKLKLLPNSPISPKSFLSEGVQAFNS